MGSRLLAYRGRPQHASRRRGCACPEWGRLPPGGQMENKCHHPLEEATRGGCGVALGLPMARRHWPPEKTWHRDAGHPCRVAQVGREPAHPGAEDLPGPRQRSCRDRNDRVSQTPRARCHTRRRTPASPHRWPGSSRAQSDPVNRNLRALRRTQSQKRCARASLGPHLRRGGLCGRGRQRCLQTVVGEAPSIAV